MLFFFFLTGMQSELQVWQVVLCETMSSSESEVNNWHRRDSLAHNAISVLRGLLLFTRRNIHAIARTSHLKSLDCRFSSFLPIFLSLFTAVLQRCVCAQWFKLQPAAFSQKRSVDRCDFFFLSPTNPTSPQQRGRRLPTHTGMWSKPEMSTSLRQTAAQKFVEI